MNKKELLKIVLENKKNKTLPEYSSEYWDKLKEMVDRGIYSS